jgi:hypothetical protein
MPFFLKRVGAGGLFAAWAVYWAVLLAVAGRTVLRIISFASSAPKGHSSVTAGIENGRARLEALLDGRVVDGGSASLLALALWVAGPPLLLWLAWLWQRPRRDTAVHGAREALLPEQRWTPSSYHAALRRETMQKQDEV